MSDAHLIEAYAALHRAHGASGDEIISTPSLRGAFLVEVRKALGDLSERDLLMRLITLRKAKKLPRAGDLTLSEAAA